MPQEDDPVAKIAAFFERRRASHICPMCGDRRWYMNENEPYSRIYVTSNAGEGIATLSHYYPAYMLNCTNCGFVALHMKNVVDEPEDRENKEPGDERS